MIFLSLSLLVLPAATKLIANGPDGQKLVLVVLAEGYAAADQARYIADVDALIVNGLLKRQPFAKSKAAFNLYRVDLISAQSGVSKPGAAKDTALSLLFNGDPARCYVEPTSFTAGRIAHALGQVHKVDYVLVLVNERDYGGCTTGQTMYVLRDQPGTEAQTADVMAHEFGHALGDLRDEYSERDAPYPYSVNGPNCSTELTRARLSWGPLVGPNTPLPTSAGPGIADDAVGLYVGCDHYTRDVFRPTQACRMRATDHEFCLVCGGLLETALKPYVTPPPGGRSRLRLFVQLKETGELMLLRSSEVTTASHGGAGPLSPDIAIEARVGARSQRVEVTGEPVFGRAFPNRGPIPTHPAVSVQSTTWAIDLPGVTAEMVRRDGLALDVYKLGALEPQTLVSEPQQPVKTITDRDLGVLRDLSR